MYNLMLTCIVIITIMFVTCVAITVYEIVVERRGQKSSDGENDKEVCVINSVGGECVEIAIRAGKSSEKSDEIKPRPEERKESDSAIDNAENNCDKIGGNKKPNAASDKKVCSSCTEASAEAIAATDYKSSYSAKNDDKTSKRSKPEEKKFNSEFLILPEEYYSLPIAECYFYDDIVRFAYKCGADGRYRREGGEEIRKGDTKMAEVRIIGGNVFCAVGNDKLKKIDSFQNLQSVKNALESSFAKK